MESSDLSKYNGKIQKIQNPQQDVTNREGNFFPKYISGVIQHYAESLPKGRSQVLSVEGETEIESCGWACYVHLCTSMKVHALVTAVHES